MNIPSSGNPDFDKVLKWEAETHKAKNHDYANEEEPLANFLLQAEITGLDVDMVFFNAISIKVARLKELVGKGKEAKNESVEDTIGDLAVYAGLWKSWRQREGNQ